MAHNQDWREWLESLNETGVEYVVGGDYAGVPVRFISKSDLIRNECATGRQQDVVDAEQLGG